MRWGRFVAIGVEKESFTKQEFSLVTLRDPIASIMVDHGFLATKSVQPKSCHHSRNVNRLHANSHLPMLQWAAVT